MFDQHGHRSNARNASLPLAVREKLRPGRLQLALAALAQPDLTQRLQEEQHVLFYRWTLGGVALAGRLGATWNSAARCIHGRRQIFTRAFRVVSSAQPPHNLLSGLLVYIRNWPGPVAFESTRQAD